MKFCDEKIQKHLLNGGKIKRVDDNRRFEYKEIMLFDNALCFVDDPNEYYTLDKKDLTADDWEIVEPEYDWDKIIKDKVLCVFWNDGFEDCLNIDTLRGISKNGNFIDGNGCICDNCRLFNPADFKIAKDFKEYER